jgi:hypothetical protein
MILAADFGQVDCRLGISHAEILYRLDILRNHLWSAGMTNLRRPMANRLMIAGKAEPRTTSENPLRSISPVDSKNNQYWAPRIGARSSNISIACWLVVVTLPPHLVN